MLAQRPPMGWNSWNTFGSDINETLIKEVADAMVSTGLKDAGYEYVVIDDCWAKRKRNADGLMEADPAKFPSGMKALADYIHSKGLKFGMYSCAGTQTCAGYPGSFDHEFEDAKMFADWDVDFLKYDFCYKPRLAAGPILYNRMGMALKASGREILFSACNWGSDDVGKWIRSTGAHMYRSTGDISDSFGSFKNIAMSQINLLSHSGPGCYNDIDMLICGMYSKGNVGYSGGCNDIEYRTHFALWSLFASPLMIGCDVRSMNDETLAILKNAALIAINQDEEARPPFLFSGNPDSNRVIMFRHMSNNEYITAFFNFDDNDGYVYGEFYDIGLTVASGYALEFTDIFTGETVGTFTENYGTHIKSHDCKIYRTKLVKVR